jgi:hypothetical protein
MVAAVAVLALVPGSALAHEHRTIDAGKYRVIVGWDSEPPVQGQPNAATVQVDLATTDPPQPIEGTEQTLRLQVRQGRTTLQLPLHAVMGKPGSYAADLIPDQAGDAQLTLSGSINGDPVDEVFDTADGKFDAVKPAVMAAAPVAPIADPTSPTLAPTAGLNQMSAALDLLDSSDLHNLDMGLQAGSIPANASERVHQADVAIGGVVWPASLSGTAAQLSAQLRLLHEALEADDLAGAQTPSQAAHGLYHQFTSQARAWVAAQGGAEAASTPATHDMDLHDGGTVGMTDH